MSFDLKAAGGYGNGALGDVTDPEGIVNSYYLIDSFSGSTFSVAHPASGYNGIFKNIKNADDLVGEEFFIHAFACKTGGLSTNPQLGFWRVVKIVSVAYETDPATFTVDKDLSDLNASAYYWQAIWIPRFKNLTLTTKNLSTNHAVANEYIQKPGGVIVLKCSDTLTLNGGHINLVDCGLPTDTTTTYRPNTSQEKSGVLDTAVYSGCENSITKDRLLLNVGDGACWILAKNISTQSTSRIGNPNSKGVQYCRGASDSKISHTGSNVGGSSIFIATGAWSGFSAAVISKYRTRAGGRGLARAYIASNNLHSKMIPDEGLYALDTFSAKGRLPSDCNIKSFGDGQDSGSLTYSEDTILSSYARVNSVSGKLFKITKVYTGLVDFAAGKMVMVHQLQKTSGEDVNSGRFYLAKIMTATGSNITLDTAPPFTIDTENYYVQMLTVPQAMSFNLSIDYQGTPPWDEGVGGIFAIACTGTFNITGKLNLQGKGTLKNITNKLVGNHFMRSKLYIGQGHGTAFILAKNLTFGPEARIGADYSGASFAGKAVSHFGTGAYVAGQGYTYDIEYGAAGYAGSDDFITDAASSTRKELTSTGGHGGGGGDNPNMGHSEYRCKGGWFSNSNQTDVLIKMIEADSYSSHAAKMKERMEYLRESVAYIDGKSIYRYPGLQGAHILIVADTINNFSLDAISTGGEPGGIYHGGSADFFLLGKDAGKFLQIAQTGCGGAGYGGAGVGASVDDTFVQDYGDEDLSYIYAGSGGYRGGGASPPIWYYYYDQLTGGTFFGGGGAGAAYIYCNNFTGQSTTGIVTV